MKGRLNYFSKALKNYGFVCKLIEADEQIPFDHLDVSLGLDDKQRERTLVIRLDAFPLPEEVSNKEERSSEEQLLLHLFVAFPFSFVEEASGELSRLLMHFNKPLEMPGFGMDEMNRLIFYRYSLISSGNMVKKRLLIAIVGTIMLLMDALSDPIEAVAQGHSMVSVLRHSLEALTGT